MKKNTWKILAGAMVCSVTLGSGSLISHASTLSDAETNLRIEDASMLQAPSIEELIQTTKGLTKAEKEQLLKDEKELAPYYKKASKLIEEINRKRQAIFDREKKLFAEYDAASEAHQDLWDKLNNNLTTTQAFLSDERQVIRLSTALNAKEKAILLKAQDIIEVLDAKIDAVYEEADLAVQSLSDQLDDVYDEMDKIYVRSASIWDKIYPKEDVIHY